MKNKTLLIIGLVWPEPGSSAAGTRMLQLIGLFLKQGYTIVFASAAQESDFSSDLETMGVSSLSIELNSGSFDTAIQKLNPEIVLFDRFVTEEQFGWRVYENCPNALRILDTEDLHCLRLARQDAIKKGIDFQLSDLLSEPVAKREIASILRCDLSLIISEFEMQVLATVFKVDISALHYLPLFYDPLEESSLPLCKERKDFVFIGNFLHAPNWDAVKQLKEKIWPQIRKQLPEVSLHIYGAYPSQKALELHNEKEHFLVHGRAATAAEVICKSRVLLAPLRFGAGLKGKLLEAMQWGTPSITTTIGSEGIAETALWNGFVTDDFEAFATKAVQLYQEEMLWHQSQGKGFETLQKRFNIHSFEEVFEYRIRFILSDIAAHRKQHFLGALLWHHTVLSTKYMSRWIEEKNK
ncbi:glycosyltransferase [Flavobacterium humi]|uniref:Glycosyltransferase n=1 Tax=Flavobacterium humi TaxID=2562683 RepID=A0A4Z0LC43_9FLAO|nr:glycosyltransferase [Flavobacterium humi]TGD59456.1 glycosyltransferase [Flavobacterium humi]